MAKWLPLLAVLMWAMVSCSHDHSTPVAADPNTLAVKVVNAKCPIQGETLGQVPQSLTRQFQGKTVGFCCDMCPPVWDKLSDEEKASKLQAAMKP
jgi:hypothetical protein